MPRALNSTFLVHILKKEGATQLDYFQPIALCNVVYKIITRLIVERLKPWLPTMISDEKGVLWLEEKFLMGWSFILKLLILWQLPRRNLCLSN